LEEEAFGRLGIPHRTQEKLEGVALRVDGSVEIHPGVSDFYIGLIHAPGVVGGFEVRPTAFVELRGIALPPKVCSRRAIVMREQSNSFFRIYIFFNSCTKVTIIRAWYVHIVSPFVPLRQVHW